MHYQKDIGKLDRRNSYANHVIKKLKDGKYSNNFQNCINFDLSGINLNHEQDDQDKVHGSRTHNENNMTCDFPSDYTTQSTALTNYCLCICCLKLIYQDHSVSSSKNQSTTLAVLLF